MNEARRYPGQEKAVFEYYARNKEAVEALKAPAYEEKIIDHILSQAKVADTEVSVAELYNFESAPTKAKSTKAKASASSETKTKKTGKKTAA